MRLRTLLLLGAVAGPAGAQQVAQFPVYDLYVSGDSAYAGFDAGAIIGWRIKNVALTGGGTNLRFTIQQPPDVLGNPQADLVINFAGGGGGGGTSDGVISSAQVVGETLQLVTTQNDTITVSLATFQTSAEVTTQINAALGGYASQAYVTNSVSQWAHNGNADPIPGSKLVNAPGAALTDTAAAIRTTIDALPTGGGGLTDAEARAIVADTSVVLRGLLNDSALAIRADIPAGIGGGQTSDQVAAQLEDSLNGYTPTVSLPGLFAGQIEDSLNLYSPTRAIHLTIEDSLNFYTPTNNIGGLISQIVPGLVHTWARASNALEIPVAKVTAATAGQCLYVNNNEIDGQACAVGGDADGVVGGGSSTLDELTLTRTTGGDVNIGLQREVPTPAVANEGQMIAVNGAGDYVLADGRYRGTHNTGTAYSAGDFVRTGTDTEPVF